MIRFRLAFLLLLGMIPLTLFLIAWGGIVKSTGSSLGCPDWPFCYGQLVPDTSYMTPEQAREVFWEHGHRTIGALLGLCCIGLVALLWGPHPTQPALRRPALGLLGLVILQGLLGAWTVLGQIIHAVSLVHLGTSMLVLLMMLWLARESWLRRRREPPAPSWPPGRAAVATRPAVVLLIAIYLQILLGAAVRHFGATWAAGTGPASSVLGTDPYSGMFILVSGDPLAMLNLLHRYVAYALVALVFAGSIVVWLRLRGAGSPAHQLLILLPAAVVAMQVVVGIGMIAMQFRLFMRTMHLVLAAGLLAAQFLLVIELRRAAAGGAGEASAKADQAFSGSPSAPTV